jgi:3-oxoacyl-[acyl-carrier protein] reductase
MADGFHDMQSVEATLMRLSGLNSVVTGGASGLGEATARRFVEEGARVVLADLNEEGARRVAAEIDASGKKALGLRCDISDPADCVDLIDASEAFFGGAIDVFHANAGLAFSGEFTEAEVNRISRAIAVNLTGTIFSAQAALRSLRRGRDGCLLFTSSLQAVLARPARSVYTATKHAITGLVKSLALEFGPLGIRVNALAPVAIDTPLLRTQLSQISDDVQGAIDRIAANLPLRRMPTPRDFTDAVVFLASREARCITGHTLLIDCGAAAGISGNQPEGPR